MAPNFWTGANQGQAFCYVQVQFLTGEVSSLRTLFHNGRASVTTHAIGNFEIICACVLSFVVLSRKLCLRNSRIPHIHEFCEKLDPVAQQNSPSSIDAIISEKHLDFGFTEFIMIEFRSLW